MDNVAKKIKKYQRILLSILEDSVRDFPLLSEMEDQIIADFERNHFQLIRIGWYDNERIHEIRIQFDIKKDGKIWIQENLTEIPIDDELLKQGVPASDIVLGLQPPSYRKFTEYSEA